MGSLKVHRYAEDLLHIFGQGNVFFDQDILQLYAHDLSNPPFIIDFLIRRRPDAVCLVRSKDQVAAVLRYATDHRIPVTPAAGRTSAYGGAVPVKGGIVLDLSRLREKVAPDAAGLTVTCDPGVLIWDLERDLNRHGLSLLSYPTSAPSATIGGWVCNGGVGIGAWREGPIAAQVQAVEIVLPNGDTKTFRGTELDVVAECMGTTGIVTSVTLRVAKKADRVPVLAAFDNVDGLAKALGVVSRQFNPWNLTFHNPTFSQLREEAGGPKTVPRKKWSLLAVFDRPEWDAAMGPYAQAIEAAGGKMLPDATAQADWGEIFNTLRAKALGPSLAPGECVFPLEKLKEFLHDLEHRFEYAPLSMEGTLIRGGSVTLLAFALDDERRPEYPLGFAAGTGVLTLAKKHGGRAYAPGTYLASQAAHVYGSRRHARILAFKKSVDRANIMNPGKVSSIRNRPKALLLMIPTAPWWAPVPPFVPVDVDKTLNFPLLTWAMGKMAPLVKYNRPVGDRASRPAMFKAISSVSAGAFGKAQDWSVFSCSQCGFCRNVSPLTDAVGFEAGSPSGLLWWARLYLKGRLPPSRRLAELVSAGASTYVGDDVCPSRIPISQVLKDWKSQLETDLGRTVKVPDALAARIKQSEAQLAEKKKRWETPVAPPAAAAAPPSKPVMAARPTPAVRAAPAATPTAPGAA